MASTFCSRTSLVNFWFLPDFVVFMIITFVVMSHGSTMHDKHPHTPIVAYLSVIIDVR